MKFQDTYNKLIALIIKNSVELILLDVKLNEKTFDQRQITKNMIRRIEFQSSTQTKKLFKNHLTMFIILFCNRYWIDLT